MDVLALVLWTTHDLVNLLEALLHAHSCIMAGLAAVLEFGIFAGQLASLSWLFLHLKHPFDLNWSQRGSLPAESFLFWLSYGV